MQELRFRIGMISAAICLLAFSGCASVRPGPFLGLKSDDPPHLSPYNRSLSQGSTPSTVPYQSERLPGASGPQLVAPQMIPDSTNRNIVPERELPSPQTIRQRPGSQGLQAPAPGPRLPQTELGLPEPVESSGRELVLTVRQPPDVLVAESATFQIVIRNPLPAAAEDVVIECRFGDGLAFPGSSERALRQQLGSLGSSEVRTIDLSLRAERAGRHCVEFFVTATGLDATTGRQCVTCVEPTVMIDLVGPQARTAGGRLECVLTLVNVTGREVSGIAASIRHDSALIPKEASAGANRLPGRLEWDLGLLRVDERVQMQVEFACPTTSEQTCIAAEVLGRDMPPQQREICAVIRPRRTLDVSVADARDPLPVGETTTYLVTVTNRGLDALGNLWLDVDVDGGLEIVRAGDEASRGVPVGPDPGTPPQSATLSIAGPIAPDDARTLQIDVRAVHVGRGSLRVTATETATDNRATSEEPTVINPPLFSTPLMDLVGSRSRP